MDVNDSGAHRRPDGTDGARSIGDHEDFAEMALDPSQLAALVGDAGEGVSNWSTSQGYGSAS